MTDFLVTAEDPPILVAALKQWLPQESWSQIRKLIRGRRVSVGTALVLDEQRRLAEGEHVVVHTEALPPPPTAEDVEIYHCDRDIVVVNKPPRMLTLRHRLERNMPAPRKRRQPTLEEVLPELIVRSRRKQVQTTLFPVHRIDRDTSGLLVFARTALAQQGLVDQFADHDVVRVYHAFVAGVPRAATRRTYLIRDRGDGLRGSVRDSEQRIVTSAEAVSLPPNAKLAVTEFAPLGSPYCFQGHSYSKIECRLETGRTHQIRIHLAELGHPVCGDPLYGPQDGSRPEPDSLAPRLALHATQLGFTHPTTGEVLHYRAPLPSDLSRFEARLLGGSSDAPEASSDARPAAPPATFRGNNQERLRHRVSDPRHGKRGSPS